MTWEDCTTAALHADRWPSPSTLEVYGRNFTVIPSGWQGRIQPYRQAIRTLIATLAALPPESIAAAHSLMLQDQATKPWSQHAEPLALHCRRAVLSVAKGWRGRGTRPSIRLVAR